MKYICADCIELMKLRPTKEFFWYAMQPCQLCGERKLKVANIRHLKKSEENHD